MNRMLPAATLPAIDLNHPGTYLHWSVFEISVANLIVIAVMVAVFGAALLLPFPRARTFPGGAAPSGELTATGESEEEEDARM
ncbi:MAG: hypothetical protein J2P30_22900, partial [Actinobacteria bacterium]|nr:hypothetical protein [Actinomycetota bacterium]